MGEIFNRNIMVNIFKKYFWQISSFTLLLLLFLLPRNCGKIETQIEYVKVPVKEGSFVDYKPTPIDLPNYIFVNEKDTIETENPLNKELEQKYIQAQKERDSFKLKVLYFEAIQIRKYRKTFEDDNITVNVFASTTGTLDTLNVYYKTKEDSIKLKQPVFRLLAGPELQLHNNQLFPAASIGIQNKKGNIFEGSYNTNGDFSIGYKHNIWTIKK